MFISRPSLAFAIIGALCAQATSAAPPPDKPAQTSKPPHAPPSPEHDALDRFRFAPAWMPYPRFKRDPNFALAAAPYWAIWTDELQQELHILPEQKQKLLAINDQAKAEADRQTKAFKALSPAEREAAVRARGGGSSPERKKLEDDFRRSIEGVLTPQQIAALKHAVFPHLAVSLLYDEPVRRQIGLTPAQLAALKAVIADKVARTQDENIRHAERVWNLMTPQQRSQLPEIVKNQGPTSAILSIAFEVGFDPKAMGLNYPMISMRPVRERLQLTRAQQDRLAAVLGEASQRADRKLDKMTEAMREDKSGRSMARVQEAEPYPPPDKEQVEAILTPEQLAKLNDINFRRQVVLAMGYPEKRAKVSVTPEQKAAMDRLENERYEHQSAIDDEMLAQALKVLTADQRQQLTAEIDRQGRW